jgi:all-trans-retinol 13,14-reductase
MNYDIIIIGAGLGGLTAGAKLAREGKKVLLIEQHSKPGGCATTFKRGDLTFEVGLHEMDGISPRDMKTRIFNELDVFRSLEFIPVPEFYRFLNDRFDITISHQPEVTTERLTKLFPSEAEGIKTYFSQILNPRKATSGSDDANNSIGHFLDSIIRNEDLKLILMGNLGYFGDDPYSLSLAYYSAAQGSYYSGGASYIKGGSQKLSDFLAAYIREHGGEIVFSHIVTAVKTQGNKVTGIIYKRKHDKTSDIKEAYADDLIANNSVAGVADLLGGEQSVELKTQLKDMKNGASLLTVYLGFSKPLKDLGNKYYSTCIYDSSVRSLADIKTNNRDGFGHRNFILVDYGQIDSGLAPEGKSVGGLCCIDYLSDWEKLSRKEYYFRKEQVASVFIERLGKIIPGIRNHIIHCEVATSATVKRYTLNPDGSVYGFAQIPSRKMLDMARIPENLHFASAWGKTGGGFSGAIYSGYLCAYNILRRKQAARV